MNTFLRAASFVTIMCFIGACNTQKNKAPETAALRAPAAPASDSRALPSAGPADTAQLPAEICTRGAAVPLAKKLVFPHSTFRLLPDKISGEETVELPQGDKLTIQNGGCEYYVLTFRFETSRFRAEPTDAVYWYKSASTLLRQTARGLDAPLDVEASAAALQTGAATKAAFGDELRLNPEEEQIAQTLVLDSVLQLRPNRYAVVLTLAVGPL